MHYAQKSTPDTDRHGSLNLGAACASEPVTLWPAPNIRNAVCIAFSVKSVIGANSCFKLQFLEHPYPQEDNR